MTSKKASWAKQGALTKPALKVRLLAKKEKLIDPMLYDLLSCVSPDPHYETIVKTIKKYMPKDQTVFTDGVGNLIVKVGNDYTTMFSCHIDMVFRESSFKELPKKLDLFIAQDQEGMNSDFVWGGVVTDYKDNMYTYTPTTLGADDKAGIYILLQLIREKVPGLYIFHTGEEIGGVGSADICRRKPGLVKNIKRAIAFDRMDYVDIIDRQRGRVCCSSKFVNAFAEQLNDLVISPNKMPIRYKGATGSFTDTANYTGLIPECTNLSVGYDNQHTPAECLDIFWLESVLTPALLRINWDILPVDRGIKEDQYTNPVSSWWKQDNVNNYSVRKYTKYVDINYNTDLDKLPPWSLKKGYIKSCTEVGMRRLIRKYLGEGLSEFTIQQDILDVLKENMQLKEKMETLRDIPANNKKGNNVIALVTGLPGVKKSLFAELIKLTATNFQIYKNNHFLYDTSVAEYAELLEWAWSDISKFDSNMTLTSIQQFDTVKEILAEIVVINNTLVKEMHRDCDGNISPTSDLDPDLLEILVKTIAFFKKNWFHLGYDAFTGVQDELKQIRDKITTGS